jgi:serine/threonine-protein kinase
MDLPVAVGEIVANKYRIDGVIGSGGMGFVVAAFHLELEQPVAIKFLNAQAGAREDSGERFRREARAAALIRSEHVVRVLDVEVLQSRIPYMVMELLEGHDLERELEHTGPLPVVVAVHYLLQAIDAVAEAHAAGVVHRDLKPTNLFLARRPDGSRIVKVLDFGISKFVGPSWGRGAALTRSASIFGSPLYMAPEQMRSAKDVDARADIWSLGAILYELLSGRPPYVADSLPALCIAILNERPRPLHEFVPLVPTELEAVLFKCLSRNVEERFASVADLADALVPFAPVGLVHAERARRVLGRATSDSNRPPAGANVPFPPPLLHSVPPTGGSAVGPVPSPTQSAWGETKGRTNVNRRIGTMVGALVLLLGAVFLWRSLAKTGDETKARVQSALPSVTKPPAPEAAVAAPPVEPTVAAPPTSTSAASVDRPPPAATSASVATPRRAGTPEAHALPPRSGAPRHKSSGGAPALTDFGGRLH